MITKFLYFLLILFFLHPLTVFANCKMLYSKTESIDTLDDGTVFPIISIYKMGNLFGDSSPIEAIIIKKSALPKTAKDLKKLSTQVVISNGKETLNKHTLRQLASIKGKNDYVMFRDFNAQTLKDNVYDPLNKIRKLKEQRKSQTDLKAPTEILISVFYDKKLLCTQQFEIDYH